MTFFGFVGYLASIVGLVGAAWSVLNYIAIKRLEFRREDFLRYHAVVRQINVDDKSDDGNPFIEVQIASVYEMTLMPRYFELSLRILRKRLDAATRVSQIINKDLRNEIENSIKVIESKQEQRQRCCLSRLFFAITQG